MATRKTPTKKKATAKASRPAATDNGMNSFSMHVSNEKTAPMVSAVDTELESHPRFGLAAGPTISELDPETAAQRYLDQALASDSVKKFSAPKSVAEDTGFKSLGTETIPLTGTTIVKFRQTLNKIPIYGSLVTVELGKENKLINLNSSVGEPKGVSPVAKVSPAQAMAAVKKYPGYQKGLEKIVPKTYFYYDQNTAKWRLVYIFEDVPVTPSKKAPAKGIYLRIMDYVVDAQSGKVVAELPRAAHMASVEETIVDGLGVPRKVTVESAGSGKMLKHAGLNVQTFDFKFQDPDLKETLLPGKAIKNPPRWNPMAISAHANATAVAEFLRTVLRRNNIDNNGGAMNSSINCLVAAENEGGNVWRNAFWNGREMVYGQVLFNGSLLSICVDLDVVAHEMFHGVTDNTSRLEYANQSGALNESYSDIFGIIVTNFDKPNTDDWNWKLGERLDTDGRPFRDMSDPASLGQPAKMSEFRVLPNSPRGDFGGVHINSGIHNKAAHLILTAKDASGEAVLTPMEAAAIFYLAVSQRLSRTSQFADSRRAVVESALSLFLDLPVAKKKAKIAAIDDAFDAVEIPGERVVVS